MQTPEMCLEVCHPRCVSQIQCVRLCVYSHKYAVKHN